MAIVPFARNSVNKNQANDLFSRQTKLNKLVGSICYLDAPTRGLPAFLRKRETYEVVGWSAKEGCRDLLRLRPLHKAQSLRDWTPLEDVVFDFEGPR